jgi:ABC-type Fe3+/spermidine/putrescine transport system ATPase subunit
MLRLPSVIHPLRAHSTIVPIATSQVLQGVTGEIRPGEVTAVMGPSGAGKTSFMMTLAGKAHGRRLGRVLVNGVERRDLKPFQRMTGFVPQEDVLHRNLTVGENMQVGVSIVDILARGICEGGLASENALHVCVERRAVRTGDGFQNWPSDSLLAYPTTLLQTLGLQHRRYGALTAWHSGSLRPSKLQGGSENMTRRSRLTLACVEIRFVCSTRRSCARRGSASRGGCAARCC